MFGRSAVLRFRVAAAAIRIAGKPRAQHRLHQPWRVPFSRTYATPGRPKSVVGEPSKSPKRTVKKTAGESSTSSSTGSPKKKTRSGKSVGKANLTPAEKEAAKEQARAKSLKKKEKAKLLKIKEDVKVLKDAALTPPSLHLGNSWTTFIVEKFPTIQVDSNTAARDKLTAPMQELKQIYNGLSESEVETYRAKAQQHKVESQEEYRRWVQQRTPEDIEKANIARAKLRKIENVENKVKERKKRRTAWPAIQDLRAAQKPRSAYVLYFMERSKDRDSEYESLSPVEKVKTVSREWRAFSDEQKERYYTLAAEEANRWRQRFADLPAMNDGQQVAAAAAA